MALALGGMLLAWFSRSAHWLYLRVEPEGGGWPRRLVLCFPLPLGALGGLLPAARRPTPIPVQERRRLGKALKQYVTPETPIHIQVDDGDRVEVFIG